MRFRVVAGLAAGMLALGGGAVANASATATALQNPASSAVPSPYPIHQWYNTWNNQDMWNNGGTFYTSSSHSTRLSEAVPNSCNGSGYCEHELAYDASLCLGWEGLGTTTNAVEALNCTGASDELWKLTSHNGGYVWENLALNSVNASCIYGNNSYHLMLTVGSQDKMNMDCPLNNDGTPGQSQIWATRS